jgi:hypothetical protein
VAWNNSIWEWFKKKLGIKNEFFNYPLDLFQKTVEKYLIVLYKFNPSTITKKYPKQGIFWVIWFFF